MINPITKVIEWQSKEYNQALRLRDKILRQPIGMSIFNEDLGSESDQFHFGIFIGDKIVACACAKPIDSKVAKIRQAAVYPEHQRKGFGKMIMNFCESELHAKGFEKAILHARKHCSLFYTKIGYEQAGEEFVELGITHIRMEKALG